MSILNKLSFVIIVIVLFAGVCSAQDEDVQNKQMQIWMDYMTPGPMHELMASGVGEWTTVSKFWMDPAGEPMVTEGSGTTEMILGGRYEKSVHKSNVMGMPSEGMWLMGYDNATEEFTAIWIDNLGTGTAIAKGTFDETTNSINLIGTMVDPMTGEYMDFHEVRTYIDENNQLLEMFMTYNGQEFKTMEIEFTRK